MLRLTVGCIDSKSVREILSEKWNEREWWLIQVDRGKLALQDALI